MGTPDSYTKEYMQNSEIFADVYNFLLGKKVVDHAMVARIMIYDALRYYNQLQKIAAKHKSEKDVTNSEDFISKFTKNDRLTPVITVVVYYGSKPWDASCDLFGLFDECYAEFLPLMNNYKIKVFEASRMTDRDYGHSKLLICVKRLKI